MKKNIRQYGFFTEDGQHSIFLDMIERYKSIKNIVYNEYSSESNYDNILNHRQNIRNEWLKLGKLDNQCLPQRFVRNAIEDSCSNIKTIWTNKLNNVKKYIAGNNELTNNHKHLLYYCLKIPHIVMNISCGNYHNITLNDNFDEISYDNKIKLFNLLRRKLKDNETNIPKCNKNSFVMLIDDGMYSYKIIKGELYFCLMSDEKGKRIEIKVNTQHRFKGNVQLILKDKCLIISKAEDIEIKPLDTFNTDKIGVDKNYIRCFDTDNGNSYGDKFSELLDKKAIILSEKNQKRQQYHDIINDIRKKDVIKPEDQSKIDRITKNNLGKKKYNKIKNNLQSEINKHVNHAINTMINNEKPKEIVIEKLNFQISNNNKKKSGKKVYSKKTNMKLSNWNKGYMNERLKYKSELKGITITEVNAAYTSQECPQCHCLGKKQEDIFYCSNEHCSLQGGVKSGHSAARVIKQRSEDKDIGINTSPKQVLVIIKNRLVNEKCTEST